MNIKKILWRDAEDDSLYHYYAITHNGLFQVKETEESHELSFHANNIQNENNLVFNTFEACNEYAQRVFEKNLRECYNFVPGMKGGWYQHIEKFFDKETWEFSRRCNLNSVDTPAGKVSIIFVEGKTCFPYELYTCPWIWHTIEEFHDLSEAKTWCENSFRSYLERYIKS